MEGWLVLDGYEDEPAAFGVPNYVGFHIRYVCGVLEARGVPYTYMTIDQWRLSHKKRLEDTEGRAQIKRELSELDGAIVLAGAIVPGKYIRGTPISRGELDKFLAIFPYEQPVLCGGWAIKHWRYDGWTPLRSKLFCAVNDVDASLDHYLSTGEWSHSKRTAEQWSEWALAGARSKAVTTHPDFTSWNCIKDAFGSSAVASFVSNQKKAYHYGAKNQRFCLKSQLLSIAVSITYV